MKVWTKIKRWLVWRLCDGACCCQHLNLRWEPGKVEVTVDRDAPPIWIPDCDNPEMYAWNCETGEYEPMPAVVNILEIIQGGLEGPEEDEET